MNARIASGMAVLAVAAVTALVAAPPGAGATPAPRVTGGGAGPLDATDYKSSSGNDPIGERVSLVIQDQQVEHAASVTKRRALGPGRLKEIR